MQSPTQQNNPLSPPCFPPNRVITSYHEALGDSLTREQLLAMFDAYETIAKDAPDALEKIFRGQSVPN